MTKRKVLLNLLLPIALLTICGKTICIAQMRQDIALGSCGTMLIRFEQLLSGLRFDDAQRCVDSMYQVPIDSLTQKQLLLRRWAAALLSYFEKRQGAQLDTLELLYNQAAQRIPGWACSWFGFAIAQEYTRNENPAVALMYARTALQVARSTGDSIMEQNALIQVLINYAQLGNTTQADSLLADCDQRIDSTHCAFFDLPRALLHVAKGEWKAAGGLLDSLRNSYYLRGNLRGAGYVTQVLAEVFLEQGNANGALQLLRWADALPSQRTPTADVLASWQLYGRCYLALGDYAKAINYFQRALTDADAVRSPLYKAHVLTNLGDAYSASGKQRLAYEVKRSAVTLCDSESSSLSVKLFQSADNMRTLQDRMSLYEQQVVEKQKIEQLRTRKREAVLVMLVMAILLVDIVLYRLWGVITEKQNQRDMLQSITVSLQKRGQELKQQGERLERLHAEGVRQTNRLLRVHDSMRSRAATIMQSMSYASLIQQALLPTEQERKEAFDDSFLITRALQVVSGDLLWLGSYSGLTIVAVVDCSGYGVSGASLSLIASMLLSSVVREQGVSNPATILREFDVKLRRLMQGADKRFQSEMAIDLSVLAINPATRVARFSGEGRQLLYCLDGRSIHCLHGKAYSLNECMEHARPLPTVAIPYEPGASFYMLTDGLAKQLNSDNEMLGMHRIGETLQSVVKAPMDQQCYELLGLFARHRLAAEQTNDITVLGMKLA